MLADEAQMDQEDYKVQGLHLPPQEASTVAEMALPQMIPQGSALGAAEQVTFEQIHIH